jgi:hypothetical protein
MKWMCIIALAPELGIAMAADEFWQAWKLTGRVGSPGFTMTHAFYALMGGFIIAVPAEAEGETLHDEGKVHVEGDQARSEPLQNLEYFTINSRAVPRPHPGFHSAEKYEMVDVVALAGFRSITQEKEHPSVFPRVAEDIKNQAKSDPLTKAFAVLQCTWLIVQSIARTSKGLELTELELTTLAFTTCAFIMYGFWWFKPFDAQRPVQVLSLDSETIYQVL